MDRLQEWEGLHDINAHEAALYDDQPAYELLRYALFGPATAAPSTSIVAVMRANVQMGGGYAA